MEQIAQHSGEYGIYLVGFLLIILAYVGSVTPSIPGPPIALAAIYLVHFTINPFSTIVLIVLSLLAIAMAIADYIVPVLGTKKFGGTKYGVKGSTIGLVLGVVITIMTSGFGILFLLLGPFIGAFVGEKYAKNSNEIALKSAFGSLLGFLIGTLGKIIVVTIILFSYLYNIFT